MAPTSGRESASGREPEASAAVAASSRSMSAPTPRLEDLQWLRALAARLVRDPHLADDAVQETMVAALERGPSEPRALRAWLSAVLHNVLRQTWRGEARRSAREAALGSPHAQRTALEVPLDIIVELDLHRRLADEVHALAEPYRTAILLRYLRARSTEEIARELGTPIKTVRTRLERGLARLRARLGRDRTAWALLLTGAPPRTPLALGPALLLSMKAKLIGSLLALTLVGAFFVLRDGPGVLEESQAGTETLTSSAAPPSGSVDGVPDRREPPAEASRAPEQPAAQPSADSRMLVRGHVRTLDGAGLAGVTVLLEQK